MTETPESAPAKTEDGVMAAVEAPPLAPAGAPLCYVVDDEASIRHFLSLVLHGAGIDTMEFPDGADMRAAIGRRVPDLVFLNISLESADAIETVIALGKSGFAGNVQLMSMRGAAVLEHVKNVGVQHQLTMLPVLKKPFETDAIVRILQELKLGTPAAAAGEPSLSSCKILTMASVSNGFLSTGSMVSWCCTPTFLTCSSTAAPRMLINCTLPAKPLFPSAITVSIASADSSEMLRKTRSGTRRPIAARMSAPSGNSMVSIPAPCSTSERKWRMLASSSTT